MALQISDTSPRVQYTATAGQTTFSVPFEFFDDEDLLVINTNAGGVDTTLTLSSSPTLVTEYSVTGAGVNGGGSITLGSGATLNDKYTILRNLPTERVTDFPNTGTFPINSLNTELDKFVALLQQLEVDINLVPKAASTTSTAYGLTFPELVANKILSVNSAGTGLIFSQEIGNFRGNWAASTAYVQRDLVKDTSNGNIYIVNTAHTSSGSQPLSSNANSSYYDLIVDAASATSSASAALASATAAAASATAAAASETAAAASETAAATSETNAATSATTASTQASNAASSATAAATSATNAATSATNASNSASAAATSATNAATSATAAASSASAAATSETNAATSASAASTSATNAATSESNAATSASNASTSETNAANSATSASTSATNATTSATNASNSASAAAASAASAANSYDQFDDRYLGTKTSDPTLDNDGNALVAGALYFNSSANEMRVYDGANWIPASSAGTASLIIYEYTATSGQTTFSGTDDNAATLSYSVNNLFVTLNGVVLDPDDYTATSGTSIVLGTGATTGDLLTVHAFKSFSVSELNANNLTDGTIPDARFPAVLPAVDGSNLTGITSVGGATGVDFNDDVKARFGSSNELQIYKATGGNSYIQETGTSNLRVCGTEVFLRDGADTENLAVFRTNGANELYYDNSKKLETTSSGITVTGNILTGVGSATAPALQVGDANTGIFDAGANVLGFTTNGTHRINITGSGHLVPVTTNTYDLGGSALVWRNIYTSDFHMTNEGLDKGNDIDGTKGSWTFQEGEENLYLINNKNGKKYKFNLTEIE